jgi:GTPase
LRQRGNGVLNTFDQGAGDHGELVLGGPKVDDPTRQTRTLIVCPILKNLPNTDQTGIGRRDAENILAEAVSLAAAIDLQIVETGFVVISKPRPATMIGKGKLDDIGLVITAEDIDLVVFDGRLSPVQQRNLERHWKVKVLDRTGLILEIFGRRAQTAEGRLQVELAHLNYQRSRLVRSWTHLERQRGGFGFLGGPGETQIEADRRQISERITKIKRLLVKVQKTRALHRSSRKKVPYPVVALVGYTNAGKSTLFNRLTDAKVIAKDQLFATLDPTMRGLNLPSGRRVILSDTVGFISELPHELVAAFRATLEEVVEADIILHVRDIAHEETDIQAADVIEVLKTLGIDTDEDRTLIEAWNKIDLLAADRRAEISNQAARRPNAVAVSAVTGEGLQHLIERIEKSIDQNADHFRLTLQAEEGKALNWLYENIEIVERNDDTSSGGINLQIRVPDVARRKLEQKFGARLLEV